MFFSVFWKFLLLGCTSFGGPAAHIGYFRKEFVERLGWATPEQYSQWVALSQIMPGPGSSQVGFAVGYHRAGIYGGIAAFVGFTLPSFILMYFFAVLGTSLAESSLFLSILASLKLMALVIVVDAVIAMSKSFCYEMNTRFIAIISAAFILLWPFGLSGVFLVIFAGAVGAFLCAGEPRTRVLSASGSFRSGLLALSVFVLLFILSTVGAFSGVLGFSAQLFQAGSLVFGGGHVVLPLLSESFTSELSTSQLLAGYAAAQAVPGPMFTLATYIGTVASPSGVNLIWALLATLAIFLPGLLLMLVGQVYWQKVAHISRLQGAVKAINAAVVGLLLATLIFPLVPSSVTSIWQLPLIISALVWLRYFKPAIWQLILLFVVAGAMASLF